MALRGLIYDHDGTLIDSIDLVVEATNEALTGAGFPPASRALVMRGMVYPTLERFAFHTALTDATALQALFDAYYAAAWRVGSRAARPYAGVATLLERVAARGLKQGMLSNNLGRFVRRVLADHGLDAWLDPILGEEDVPAPKPAAAGLLLIAETWGLPVEDVLLVGDSAADAGAARAAGCPSIGVTWGTHPRADLAAAGFDHLIDRPEDLPALLRTLA
jgi:phosphoglycolate phosphatase